MTGVMKEMEARAEEAAELLKIMAHPKRLLILCCLAESELSVGALEELLAVSQSSLSQHLAKMRDLNLVDVRKEGQMVYYRVCRMEVKALLSVLYLIYCKPG